MQTERKPMFVYLANSGRCVVLPGAVALQDNEQIDTVSFVDEAGEVVAVFFRADVSVYSLDELTGAFIPSEDGNQAPVA
jgi:hypothetical protein